MFKFTYILLFFAFLNAKAEEPTLMWEKNKYGVIHSMYFLNDTTLLMHGNNFGGVTFFINPETGQSFDTIFHGVNVVNWTRISPNGKIIALGNIDRVVLFDLELKIFIKEYASNRDIVFKDDENIYIFYDGVYKINIITDEKELIWKNEAIEMPQGWRIYLNQNCRFSPDAKYAVAISDIPYYINLETKELMEGIWWWSRKIYPVFNPARPNELIGIDNNKIGIVNIETLEIIKSNLYLEEEIRGNYFGTYSEDGKHFAFYYSGWLRIYDLDTYEVKSKLNLAGIFYIFHKNFIYFTNGGKQFKYDISSFLSKKENNLNSINIFPNPSEGRLLIDFSLLKPDKYELKIINSIGQEVFYNNLGFIAEGKSSLNFELSLPNGTYQVLINNGMEINYSSKFIILK